MSIVSRKVINYALIYISKPGFINYQILKAFATESTRANLRLDDYKFVSLSTQKLGQIKAKTETATVSVNLKVDLKYITDTIDGASTPKDSPKRNGAKIVSEAAKLQKNISENVIKDTPTEIEEDAVDSSKKVCLSAL